MYINYILAIREEIFMMKTISFINLKGGVGKTLISTNLAYALAESWGVRVLFIDNDKQGNASTWFGADQNIGTIANIFLDYTDGVTAKDVIQSTRYEKIDLIAADIGLIDANLSVTQDSQHRQDDILKNALADVRDQYDLCIIDNPPDINMSVFNSLVITDDVVIVTFPEYDSVCGVYKMVEQCTKAKIFNPALTIRGILFNEYLSSLDVWNYADEMKKAKFPVFRSHIRYATRNTKKAMGVARTQKLSMFEYCPQSGVTRDLMKFAEEIFGK
jgi:chromosome partitioning protein